MPAVPVNAGGPASHIKAALGRRTPGYVGVDPGVHATFRSDALDKLTATPEKQFGKSPTLKKTKSRDAARRDAIGYALQQAKHKYIYTSGNLRDRLRGYDKGTARMEET